jgi:hypothetical protein
MGVLGRLLGLLFAGFVVSSIAAAIGARVMKNRLVRVDTPEADEVHLVAIMEPIDFRSTATNFRGGTLDCWYGGGVVDLRGATLDPAGARLEVRGIFGGGQIIVPESWRVRVNVQGVGGIGDARQQIERPVTAPLLTVEGVTFMGGFGITSELSQGEADAVAQAVARRGRRNGVMETAEPVTGGATV